MTRQEAPVILCEAPSGPFRQKGPVPFFAYENGTAVYNPLGNRAVLVRFSDRRRSVATGKVDEEHALGCPDGDIFLKLK